MKFKHAVRKPPFRAVIHVTQSPLNAVRWSLDLECGHDEWVTSKSRPSRTRMRCAKCRSTPP